VFELDRELVIYSVISTCQDSSVVGNTWPLNGRLWPPVSSPEPLPSQRRASSPVSSSLSLVRLSLSILFLGVSHGHDAAYPSCSALFTLRGVSSKLTRYPSECLGRSRRNLLEFLSWVRGRPQNGATAPGHPKPRSWWSLYRLAGLQIEQPPSPVRKNL